MIGWAEGCRTRWRMTHMMAIAVLLEHTGFLEENTGVTADPADA